MSAWQRTHPRGMARDEIEHAVNLGQISDLSPLDIPALVGLRT